MSTRFIAPFSTRLIAAVACSCFASQSAWAAVGQPTATPSAPATAPAVAPLTATPAAEDPQSPAPTQPTAAVQDSVQAQAPAVVPTEAAENATLQPAEPQTGTEAATVEPAQATPVEPAAPALEAVEEPAIAPAPVASSQLEGDSIGGESPQEQPNRLTGYQAAGWWTLFGAVALTTTGGLFLGLMDTEAGKARRIAEVYDPASGQHPVFATVKADYNDHLDRANTYQHTAHALLITGGVALLASIPLFVIHARKTNNSHLSFRHNGLGVRF